jgi:elongation factor P
MLDILLFNNKIISIDFPLYVILKVKKSLPSVKGNTLNNANKIIEFDTGYCCQVPLFIKIGNMIKINTNNGKYIERIN